MLEHDGWFLSDAGVRSHALLYICLTYGFGLAPLGAGAGRCNYTHACHPTPRLHEPLAVNTASYLTKCSALTVMGRKRTTRRACLPAADITGSAVGWGQ